MRPAMLFLRMRSRSLVVIACAVIVTSGLFARAEQASAATGDYIVVLNDDVANPGAVASQHGNAYGFQARFVYGQVLKGYAAALTSEAVAELAADPLVRMVAPDRTLHLDAPPPQPPQFQSNGVLRIEGPLSSTASGDGKGSVSINVAILDTGIDTKHPDLNARSGIDCVAERDPSPVPDPAGHGTMVAGFLGAVDNKIGVVGVAPGATLWSARVLDSQGFGTDSELICGIDWVTASRLDSSTQNDIALANLSLGDFGRDDGNCGLTNKDPVHLAICRSTAAGITYIVAAGNETVDVAREYPASYNEVLTVTAMADKDGVPGGLGGHLNCLPEAVDDTAAFFSNFATFAEDQAHTVAAPGACIASTFTGGIYAVGSGTSFATPLVSGTVALCIATGKCAGLTPAQILAKIVADAATYNNLHPVYGFVGDPINADMHRYYGYLIHAAEY